VNFYKRFIGDIQAKTGNLSLAEFGAYDRLLDHYYSTEQPIPADADECYRICRAMSKEERKAVDKVIARFFERTDKGYVQSKAEEQIAAALPLIQAARENGKKGGRPKKPKTQTEPAGFSKETQSEPSSKASQSQISPSDEGEGTRKRVVRPDDVTEQTWADWTQLRKTKRATVTETVIAGAREEAGKAGLPLERFLAIWCRRGSMGLEASWLKPEERRPSQPSGQPHKFAAASRAIFGPSSQEVIDVETH
jgi:uncharacterized protein YdaU (DUF1376 family)